jgi:hypothetical protein
LHRHLLLLPLLLLLLLVVHLPPLLLLLVVVVHLPPLLLLLLLCATVLSAAECQKQGELHGHLTCHLVLQPSKYHCQSRMPAGPAAGHLCH